MSGDRIDMRYALALDGFRLDVDLSLPLNGITGVYGASGSGKTSLLRCIAGLVNAGERRLRVAGDVWEDSDQRINRPAHQRDLGYVFQDARLFPHLDVAGNLNYGRRRRRPDGRTANFDNVVELLGLVQLLGRRPQDLSGGEAQRVAIARALLCAPRFILMDEPLASLDRARKNDVLPYLDRLHSELAVPIVYVSHSIDEICRLCDQLVVMQDGRALANDALGEVLTRLDLPMLNGDEAGSVLQSVVLGYDEEDDLTRLRFSGGEFLVAGNAGAAGQARRLRIRANDVSLCRERPGQSTILNILPVIVERLGDAEGSMQLLRLKAGDDTLLARVSRRSVREMALKPGAEVLAQIKSAAIREPQPG